MAQEFGDHPQAAAERMRWVRQLAAEAAALATCEPGPEPVLAAGIIAAYFKASSRSAHSTRV
jgi:hypothetical protein